MPSKIPVWLDVDPGHDDAFAILLAAYHPSLDLLGVSTVHGNASLKKTTNNALSVLQAIGRPDVPVFPGAAKPFCREAHAAPDIHGESGLDGTALLPKPTRSALSRSSAIVEMYDALIGCSPNTACIVATGTLTNVGVLFATFPALVGHIRGLSIMGGAIGNNFTGVALGPDFTTPEGQKCARIGNVTPYAEFNIWCDPEAAQSILRNEALRSKIILIPLDVTHQAFAGEQVQNILLHGRDHSNFEPTQLRRMFNELLMFFAHTYSEVFGLSEGPPLHDPIAVAVLLDDHTDQDFRIEFHYGDDDRWDVNVQLSGEEVGRTVIAPAKDGVRIPRSFNLAKFWAVLDECMAEADRHLGDGASA